MNRFRSPSRRVLAVAASAFIGIAGAVAIASPASAHHTNVTGTASCPDPETGEWVVTWTVTSWTPPPDHAATQYKITDLEVTLGSTDVTGISLGELRGVGETFEGQQVLQADDTSAQLRVSAKWNNDETRTNTSARVEPRGDCEKPTPTPTPAPTPTPEELGTWTFDCETLTITGTNPTDEDVTLTFTPSAGDAQDVDVAAGESATVEFPASEGLTVDVSVEGKPVELEQPIEITSEAWAERECDEDAGGGGGLPQTGISTGAIAGGALVLLLLGGGLYLLARRRRVTFTA